MRTLLLLSAIACKNPTPTDPTDGVPTDGPVPTDVPAGNERGNLALVRGYQDGVLVRSELLGVFTDNDQGVVNLAQCVHNLDWPCIRAMPEEGESRSFDPISRFANNQSFYSYVGLTVPLGPYETYYQVGDRISYYSADLSDLPDTSGPAPFSVGVEWGDFAGSVDIPGPLFVNAPLPDAEGRILAFSDENTIDFEWVPTGAGDMVLIVQTTDVTDPGRVFSIPDTGSYSLDLSALNYIRDKQLRVQLARWTNHTVDVNGNQLVVQLTAEQDFEIELYQVGISSPITPQNACFPTPPILPEGNYYGDLSGLENTFEIESGCLDSVEPTEGRDAVFTVQIPPRHRMEVGLRQIQANGALYLLESCSTLDPVCVAGSDTGFGIQRESIVRFNAERSEEEVFTLVLDGIGQTAGGIFFVDLEYTPVPEPSLSDTCANVEAIDPLVSGQYYIGPNAFSDEHNPGFQGCTGSSQPGADAVGVIVIPPQRTLEVTASMTDGNPALYLVDDCFDLTTCVEGNNVAGSFETLTYLNNTNEPQRKYLVLDTADELLPTFFNVSLF